MRSRALPIWAPVVAAGVLVALLGGCSVGVPASGAPTGHSTAVTGAAATRTPTFTPPPTPTATAPTPTPPPTPTATAPTPTPTPTTAGADAVVRPVPDAQWARIVAVGAWHPGCPVGQAQLRRVEVNFHGFDARVHRGVLVVNADVADSVAHIFTRLYTEGFPIHRMQPIEVYGGDDNASMAADNTSAYNCRRASQANAPATASPHGNGRAIDVNPYENPWIDPRCACFQPDAYYGRHRSGTGVITKGGTAWSVFTAAGWIWQDNATIDYQHFDTGYPSRPLPSTPTAAP